METQKRLIETTLKIQNVLSLSSCEMGALLGLDSKSYDEVIEGSQELGVEQLWSLTQKLIISPQSLLEGRLDYHAIKGNFNQQCSVAAFYDVTEHKLSSANGIKTIITFLNSLYGERFTRNIFFKFQIDPELFLTSGSGRVSSWLPYDILAELSSHGLYRDHFRIMGERTFESLERVAGHKLEKNSKGQELYECLVEEVIPEHYDNLFNYQILKSTKSSSVIRISVSEESLEHFSGKSPINVELESYLIGAFRSVLKFIGKQMGEIATFSSVIDGDKSSLFSISWEDSKPRLPYQPVH